MININIFHVGHFRLTSVLNERSEFSIRYVSRISASGCPRKTYIEIFIVHYIPIMLFVESYKCLSRLILS